MSCQHCGKNEAQNNMYKEAATRVVELQRQNMNLTAKLRNKVETDNENAKLKDDLNEYKQKFFDSNKKYLQSNDQIREMQA